MTKIPGLALAAGLLLTTTACSKPAETGNAAEASSDNALEANLGDNAGLGAESDLNSAGDAGNVGAEGGNLGDNAGNAAEGNVAP